MSELSRLIQLSEKTVGLLEQLRLAESGSGFGDRPPGTQGNADGMGDGTNVDNERHYETPQQPSQQPGKSQSTQEKSGVNPGRIELRNRGSVNKAGYGMMRNDQDPAMSPNPARSPDQPPMGNAGPPMEPPMEPPMAPEEPQESMDDYPSMPPKPDEEASLLRAENVTLKAQMANMMTKTQADAQIANAINLKLQELGFVPSSGPTSVSKSLIPVGNAPGGTFLKSDHDEREESQEAYVALRGSSWNDLVNFRAENDPKFKRWVDRSLGRPSMARRGGL